MIQKRPWVSIIALHKPEIDMLSTDTLRLRQRTIKEINKMILASSEPEAHYPIKDPFDNMKKRFLELSQTENIWFDLPIVISTFKERNNLIFYKIREEIAYLYGYVYKLITSVYDSRETNDISSSENKDITSNVGDKIIGNSSSSSDESITPQLGQVAFDNNTLDFRSAMERIKGNSDTSRNIESNEKNNKTSSLISNKKKLSFEEQKKLDLERYKAVITDYVNRIPYIIYDYYSLDITPPELLNEILEG